MTTRTTPAMVKSAPNASRTFDARGAVERRRRAAPRCGGTRDAADRREHASRVSVTSMPTANDHTTVPALTLNARRPAPAKPSASNSACNPAARPMPDERVRRSTRRCRSSTRFERDRRSEHLPARRADRTEQRGLARALGDDDRERVVDAERRDEQRDAGEHEQERFEEPEEVVVDVLVVLRR